MAEFMNQRVEEPDLFAAMGKPLHPEARSIGYRHCRAMGLESGKAWGCVQVVAEQLERDRPYEAMQEGRKYLDLTGTYRLFAALLAAQAEMELRERKKA